jgi:hypothetical protein
MQRKQQVGECWVCVIFFACVCVCVCGVRQIRQLYLTIPFAIFAIFSRFFFGQFLLFLADFFFLAVFAIFSGFVN